MKKNESLQSKNFNSKNETKNKKKFIAPKIEKLGNIAAHSQTASATGNSDGGSFPNDRMGMCLTPPPSIEEHRILVTDQVCQNQFLNIITQKVKPGDVVLDLGCGSGIHSLIAAQAGAKRVYAVDGDQILQFTKKVIEKNRMGHIIECIQGHFFKVELPEKVDVIISNLGFLQSLIDLPKLKHKFLKPGGIMIPDGLSLEFSLAAIPDF